MARADTLVGGGRTGTYDDEIPELKLKHVANEVGLLCWPCGVQRGAELSSEPDRGSSASETSLVFGRRWVGRWGKRQG